MSTNRGYLYVIAFDNGIIKGGRTDDITRRYDEHRRDAGRFGVTIAKWWFWGLSVSCATARTNCCGS